MNHQAPGKAGESTEANAGETKPTDDLSFEDLGDQDKESGEAKDSGNSGEGKKTSNKGLFIFSQQPVSFFLTHPALAVRYCVM